MRKEEMMWRNFACDFDAFFFGSLNKEDIFFSRQVTDMDTTIVELGEEQHSCQCVLFSMETHEHVFWPVYEVSYPHIHFIHFQGVECLVQIELEAAGARAEFGYDRGVVCRGTHVNSIITQC